MNSSRTLFVCAFALAWPLVSSPAWAEMYKYVDEQGRVTYSNKPIKGGHKVDLPEISTVPAPKIDKSKLETPATTGDRDQHRKDLQDQIAKEEKALADAKQAYKDGADKPEVWRRTKTIVGKDGKPVTITETGRNVPAYEEKMKQLQADVDAHQKKLDQLKAELAALDQPATIGPAPATPAQEKK